MGLFAAIAHAEDLTYQLPPAAIADVVNAPRTPFGILNPQGSTILLGAPVLYPPIGDLAKPMLRLAGTRLDPTTNGPHHPTTWKNLIFKSVLDKKETPVRLPAGVRPGKFAWNAAGTRVAFESTTDNGIELWVADAATGDARRIPGVVLSDMLWGRPFAWISNGKRLLVRLVPADRGAPPAPPAAPSGPKILEARGVTKPTSTYEARDVLKNEFDARLFDYYATAQLALVDPDTGAISRVGKPAIYDRAAVSPDGKYIAVWSLHRPYSYELTADRFPMDIDVWTIAGEPVCNVARLPLADQVPIHGVRTGPRNVNWQATENATLTWSEALDGGDWRNKVPFRSRIMRIQAPFKGQPEELFKTQLRSGGMMDMQSGRQGWVWAVDEDRHWLQYIVADLSQSPARLRVVWEGSRDESYGDPGSPDMVQLPNGWWVVRVHDGSVFLGGNGGTPEGDRPFLDRLDLATGKKVRLFRCDQEHDESFIGWVHVEQGLFLTRRESPTEPPNFFLRRLTDEIKAAPKGEAAFESTMTTVTEFPDPVPALRKIAKRLVTYKRPDGVELSFMLLLPPDYKPGTRYPTVIEAYPLDYTDKGVAGQVRESPRSFMSSWGPDVQLLALAGYVVLYNAAIPIVGPSMKAYDTYIEQLTASAKAAIDKAVEIGVTDPNRVGVIGHSHGALMVANLLAHTTLFKAGVARSGAYNKTLTMFGFQSERRTLWEGRETYLNVSPLFFADKIKAPLLLIHGDLDQNPGTTPLQSERMFEAVRGVGGTTRLVMLPFEGHGYQSLESVQHVLYEMVRWFDMYVKNAPGGQGTK
jgi:dipeptidyl aminopeptidase/acylaminoacyl peptidase